MGALRPEERWAAACIEASLKCSVVQHDDGSRPGMYDLDIVYSDGRTGAVEVTSATHAGETQFWKLATSGDRWTDTRLQGGWLVQAVPTASVKALRAGLPGMLAELEVRGFKNLSDAGSDDLLEVWEPLGIVSARQSATDHPGSIYLLPRLPAEKSGGAVPDHSDGLAQWLTTWAADPTRADNLNKLQAGTADERHLFVFVPLFSTAPFEVQWLLLDADRPLPACPPRVPVYLTDVWITGTMNTGLGFRWTRGQGWDYFDRCVQTQLPA